MSQTAPHTKATCYATERYWLPLRASLYQVATITVSVFLFMVLSFCVHFSIKLYFSWLQKRSLTENKWRVLFVTTCSQRAQKQH